MNRKQKGILLALLFILAVIPDLTVKAKESENTNFAPIDTWLSEVTKEFHLPSLSIAIVDKEKVLFSACYGEGSSPDTPYIIGSMSKSFTAAAIMQLMEKGEIDLDAPISRYLDDIACGDQITVRQLLNHTSGIDTYEKRKTVKITDSYGSYEYANVNYGLLGEIIESVTGQKYEQYMEEHIFTPLEMTNTSASLLGAKENGLIEGYRNYFGFPVAGEPDYPDEDSWIQVPAGYISSSINDMGKYLQMYLNGGEDILEKSSIDQMFSDVVSIPDTDVNYGFGWESTVEYGESVLAHAGLVENYMSHMFLLPERGLGVVILINTNDYLVTNSFTGQISGSVALMLMGQEPITISSSTYKIRHILIDAIYFILLLTPAMIAFRLKKYFLKCKNEELTLKKKVGFLFLHLFLPVISLLAPRLFAATPLWVVRYFVPDLFLVLVLFSGSMLLLGITKIIIRKINLTKCSTNP